MKCIYLRTNTINGKQYVGQANDFNERERKWRCTKYPYAGILINNARDKYGVENFKSEILKECQTQEELNFWEQYYIKGLNTKVPNGYNLTDGGDTSSGYKFTEDQKNRMKGRPTWNKGIPATEEQKRKQSLAMKGKKSPFKKKVYQYTLDGKLVKVWDSTMECGKNGFHQGNVASCCRNEYLVKKNVYKGFIWSYTKKEDIS